MQTEMEQLVGEEEEEEEEEEEKKKKKKKKKGRRRGEEAEGGAKLLENQYLPSVYFTYVFSSLFRLVSIESDFICIGEIWLPAVTFRRIQFNRFLNFFLFINLMAYYLDNWLISKVLTFW